MSFFPFEIVVLWIILLYLRHLSPCWKPFGVRGRVRYTYWKGVFVRFVFDTVRISQIRRQVKNQATRTSHKGVLYTVLNVSPDKRREFGLIIYSHLRGAFGVARFDLSGNARAFTVWNEWQNWLRAFLLCISINHVWSSLESGDSLAHPINQGD